tara:strand:- start:11991 stop:12845 length:855 start_codon:yes stop_codon:yes gene_type:complete
LEILEISEEKAEGKIREIFSDIQSVTRSTQVGLLYRSLAVHENIFVQFWEKVRNNLISQYFERCAQNVRMRMIPPMPEDVPDFEEELLDEEYDDEKILSISRILDMYNYLGPKDLIFAIALKASLNGIGIGGTTPGSKDDLEIIPLGAPVEMPFPVLIDPENLSVDFLNAILSERNDKAIPDVWRALSNFPELLKLISTFISNQKSQEGFKITIDLSKGAAAAAAQEFPYEFVLEIEKLSKDEILVLDKKLDYFIQIIPQTSVMIHLLRACLLGESRVRRDPFD